MNDDEAKKKIREIAEKIQLLATRLASGASITDDEARELWELFNP
jgi:hypothetical protein